MDSLFTEEGKQKFIARINNLTPDSKANWGKMNVAQMLRHCQLSINNTVGKFDTGNLGFFMKMMSSIVGKQGKKQIVYGAGFKKNMPTMKAFVITGNQDFETEKKNLLEAIETLHAKGIKKELTDKHSFFGKMSVEEWDILHSKHLDHHLSQFGV
jgi:dihydropteroate synthase